MATYRIEYENEMGGIMTRDFGALLAPAKGAARRISRSGDVLVYIVRTEGAEDTGQQVYANGGNVTRAGDWEVL